MQWLDKIPLEIIAPIGILMALAPFFPEPHLWEKLQMLFSGQLTRAIDIFDLFWHGIPVTLLVLKLIRVASK